MLTEREFNLLKELTLRGSMQSLKNILADYELDDFQTYTIAFAYIREKLIIALDTGLGKTLVAAALINLDLSNNKWLFACKGNTLRQTATKLNNLLVGRTVHMSSGKQEDIENLIYNNEPNAVILVSYEVFENPIFNQWVFNNRKDFIGIVVDESQNIGHKNSTRSEMIKHMMRNCFRYQFFLSATPLTVSPTQICNQVNMIDPLLVPDPDDLSMRYTQYKEGKIVGYHHLTDLGDLLSERYISITRKDLGIKGNYQPQLVICNKLSDIPEVTNFELIKETKQRSDFDGLEKLGTILRKHSLKGQKGLIYANLSIYKNVILETFKDMYRIELLDGSLNSVQQSKVQARFNSGDIDILICNLTEGADLPCDYIVFYEQTVLYKQYIGRGERGLEGRDLAIYFMVITESYDIDFFYNNIYRRSLLLELILQKDISEIKVIEQQLQKHLSFEAKLLFEPLSGGDLGE